MATKLTKAVSREIAEWSQRGMFGLGGSTSKRNLIITLMPCGIINFRLKGLQSSYDIDIERVFNLAAKESALKSAQAERDEKMVMRKAVRG